MMYVKTTAAEKMAFIHHLGQRDFNHSEFHKQQGPGTPVVGYFGTEEGKERRKERGENNT